MKKLSLFIAALAVAACAQRAKNTDPEKYARYITAEDARSI